MLLNKQNTVGVVDFGSRAIRVLIARQDDDGPIQILGHGTASGVGCVSQGVIQDRNAARIALKRALADAQKESRVKVTSLVCGVNGKNVETFIREGQAKLPQGEVEFDDMREARSLAERDVLAAGKNVTSSVSAQEWYVDEMRVLDPHGIHGQVLKTRVHFARIPSVIEDNIQSCVEAQRCELEDLIFLPLASSLGCLTREDMELGVAMLDMGRSITGLAVYRDMRILNSHCFEWGGYHITRDVAAGIQISFEEADDLILDHGVSVAHIAAEYGTGQGLALDTEEGPLEDRQSRIKLKSVVSGAPAIVDRGELDEIVYERAKELLVKVRQHLEALGMTKHLVRGIVLTGGASGIKNYGALAEAVFQVPCRIGQPDTIEVMPQAVKSPEYAAAVGIVRHAFAYRTAARTGRVEARGAMISTPRRVGRFLKRYFF